MSNNDLQNVVEFYLAAYREGWQRSTKNTYPHRKCDAKRYADSICPSAVALRKAYMKFIKAGASMAPASAEAKSGRILVDGIRAICTEYRAAPEPVTPPASNGIYKEQKPATARDKYEAACRLGFVPSAVIAAALLDVDPSYPNQLRRLLAAAYDFVPVEEGYKVVPKRTKKQLEIDELKAEIDRLADKLAQMED